MTVLQLINNIALVVIIGLYLMAFAVLIIRARGEEWRRNEILATKLADRTINKLVEGIKEVAKLVTTNNNNPVNKKIYPLSKYEMDVEKEINNDYLGEP